MKIEILCTGDEILTGKTVNTNYSYMAQRFTENALEVIHGTSVGDDRHSLTQAFLQAAERADAVIVNGGLGPTVDDLSQDVAAETAGVELECHEEWLARLKEYYAGRGREMPGNNIKQAMLPAGAEFIDNPIGTACGFAININNARFFFTPGVPREMKRMVDEQVLPRLLKMSGTTTLTKLKRFHTFGIGESRVDQLLDGVVESSAIKLGFQTHFPQLETKLNVQAPDARQLDQLLEPVENEVRKRLGNFILCEDDATLESVILDQLQQSGYQLCCIEMSTGGAISQRFLRPPTGKEILQQSLVSPHLEHLCESLGITKQATPTAELAGALAEAQSGMAQSSKGTVTLVTLTHEEKYNGKEVLTVCVGIAGPDGTSHRIARMPGRKAFAQLGAAELGMDCLRRYLTQLPVDEKIDFEIQ